MTRRIAVALAGSGVIGRAHANVLVEEPDFELLAVVGGSRADFERVAALAQGAGAALPAHVASLTDALAMDDVDLVSICTPSGTHGAIALGAIEAGKHVLVEKPIDIDLVAARRVVEAARGAAPRGQVVSVVSQRRFEPAVRSVKRDIDDGRLGEIVSSTVGVDWWRDDDYYASSAWRGTWAQDGGGALINQAIHAVDVMLWWLGAPELVAAFSARRAHPAIEVEDVVAATLRMRSGVLAQVHATTGAFPGLPARLQVHGSEGSAVLEDWRAPGAHEPGWTDLDLPRPGGQLGYGRHHASQYRDIADAIRGGHAPTVTAEDGYLALATVLAIYLAARSGRLVPVHDILSGALDTSLADLGGHL